LAETDVVYGYWVRYEETKRMWKQQLANQQKLAAAAVEEQEAEKSKECTCKQHYDLHKCVNELYPIRHVCKHDIYNQVVERIGTDNICSP
jgi:hypothetical protein